MLSDTGKGEVFEEWVGEASVCDFEIVPQPSERLCSQEPSWSIAFRLGWCTLSLAWELKMEILVKEVSYIEQHINGIAL